MFIQDTQDLLRKKPFNFRYRDVIKKVVLPYLETINTEVERQRASFCIPSNHPPLTLLTSLAT